MIHIRKIHDSISLLLGATKRLFGISINWFCETMNISKNALSVLFVLGIIIGIAGFEKVNAMEEARLAFYNQSTPQEIYAVTKADFFPCLHLYGIALRFMLSLCGIGIVIMIVAIEIVVRFLELFNWKNNRIYRFLSHK